MDIQRYIEEPVAMEIQFRKICSTFKTLYIIGKILEELV